MNLDNNRKLHALLKELGFDEMKRRLVLQHTQGRTASSREMTDQEAKGLIASLQEERTMRIKKMRGKIIHYLCLLGMVYDDGKPNYKRINSFIAQIGSRNPKAKPLYHLSIKETHAVLNQVEAMYKYETKKNTHDDRRADTTAGAAAGKTEE